jgi:hypothetical protein
MLGAALSLTPKKLAVSSSMAFDQADYIYTTIPTTTGSQLYTTMLNINDFSFWQAYNSATLSAVFQSARMAEDAWLLTPNKTVAQNVTSKSAGWSANSWYGGAVGLTSTTNGASITFTFEGTVGYLGYSISNSNAGTFTVSIDGGATTTFNNSSTSTLTTKLGRTYGPQLARFTNLSYGTHTMTVTVSSATNAGNVVYIDWAAGNTGQSTQTGPQHVSIGMEYILQAFTMSQMNAFIALERQAVDLLFSDGLNDRFADFASIQDFHITNLTGAISAGATTLPIATADGIVAGETININYGSEYLVIANTYVPGSLNVPLTTPTAGAWPNNTPILYSNAIITDGVHPNNIGFAQILAAIIAAITPAFDDRDKQSADLVARWFSSGVSWDYINNRYNYGFGNSSSGTNPFVLFNHPTRPLLEFQRNRYSLLLMGNADAFGGANTDFWMEAANTLLLSGGVPYGNQPNLRLQVDGTTVLNGNCTLRTGSAAPNSAVNGNICDLYLRTTGGAGTTLYVKESGAGTNTGWVGK